MTASTSTRWTSARKEEVVRAIHQGERTEADAMREHGLSHEELASWKRRYVVHGAAGLRAMAVQELRV